MYSGNNDPKKRSFDKYNNLSRKREYEKELKQLDTEIESLDKQLEELRKGLVGLSDEDVKIIGQKQSYDLEASVVAELQKELERRKELVVGLGEGFRKGVPVNSSAQPLLNSGLIDEIRKEFQAKSTEAEERIQELATVFDDEGLTIRFLSDSPPIHANTSRVTISRMQIDFQVLRYDYVSTR